MAEKRCKKISKIIISLLIIWKFQILKVHVSGITVKKCQTKQDALEMQNSLKITYKCY